MRVPRKLPAPIVLSVSRRPPHQVGLVGNEVSHERLERRPNVGGRDTVEFAEPGEDPLPDVNLGLAAEPGDEPQVVGGI